MTRAYIVSRRHQRPRQPSTMHHLPPCRFRSQPDAQFRKKFAKICKSIASVQLTELITLAAQLMSVTVCVCLHVNQGGKLAIAAHRDL